jgi:uncharacterized protein YjbJ (UPF0337 family)
MWNKDEIKGKAEQAKGSIKKKVGELIDNDELETEGEVDQAEGAAREAAGTARRKVEEVGDAVREYLPKP